MNNCSGNSLNALITIVMMGVIVWLSYAFVFKFFPFEDTRSWNVKRRNVYDNCLAKVGRYNKNSDKFCSAYVSCRMFGGEPQVCAAAATKSTTTEMTEQDTTRIILGK